MLTFYTPEEALRWNRKAVFSRRLIVFLFIVACLSGTLLCVLARTRTALLFQWISVGICALLGCAAICVSALSYRPAKARATHINGILAGEPEVRTGVLTLTGHSFAIPKSITVRKVSFSPEENPKSHPEPFSSDSETISLNLESSLVSRLPAASFPAEVQTVRGYITGFHPLNRSQTRDTAFGSTSPSAESFAQSVRSRLRGLFSLIPMLLVWGMISLLLWCWIFSLVTDTDPAHKVTVWVDGTVTAETDLAAALEDRLPQDLLDGGIRMVKVHPFSYAMMDDAALRAGDLYILPESDLENYQDWFTPLPDDFGFPPETLRSLKGVPLGIPVFDAETCLSAAGSCIRYQDSLAPSQPWILCFGASSLHVPGNPGALDNAAVRTAEVLLSLR